MDNEFPSLFDHVPRNHFDNDFVRRSETLPRPFDVSGDVDVIEVCGFAFTSSELEMPLTETVLHETLTRFISDDICDLWHFHVAHAPILQLTVISK